MGKFTGFTDLLRVAALTKRLKCARERNIGTNHQCGDQAILAAFEENVQDVARVGGG